MNWIYINGYSEISLLPFWDTLTAWLIGTGNFEISDVDQTELILGILRYAGIIIKDTEIVQMASGLANQQDQLEQA